MTLEPSSAERARTLLHSARIATLTTYPARPPGPPRTTVVSLHDVPDGAGRPVMRLTPGAAAVADLTARPLAALTAAPPGSDGAVVIQGAARLLPGAAGPGWLAYRVEAAGVRLTGAGRTRVDVAAYRCAEPDPLRELAAGVLRHLAAHHGEDLLGCARAHGIADGVWVHPRRLDRYGLELLVVSAAGVTPLRLPFTRPLHRVADLDPGLHAVLCCRCRRGAPHPL